MDIPLLPHVINILCFVEGLRFSMRCLSRILMYLLPCFVELLHFSLSVLRYDCHEDHPRLPTWNNQTDLVTHRD